MICPKQTAGLLFAASISLPQVMAERQCPGNLASVPVRLAERTQMIVPVRINGKGPFDFLVDTGAQMSVLDTALAAQLEIKAEGTVEVIGVVAKASASFARVDALATGSHQVEQSWVLIQGMESLHRLDGRLRGLLGGTFLRHFDVLLDYDRKMLCLDETGTLRSRMKGERVPFAAVIHQGDEAVMSEPTVVETRVIGTSDRKALLLLDSGTDAAVLFDRGEGDGKIRTQGERSSSTSSDRLERAFRAGKPLDVNIGRAVVRDVSFLSPAEICNSIPDPRVDGILPTALFHHVFISYSERYVLLNPSVWRESRMQGDTRAGAVREGSGSAAVRGEAGENALSFMPGRVDREQR